MRLLTGTVLVALAACQLVSCTQRDTVVLQAASVTSWRLPTEGASQPAPRGIAMSANSSEAYVLDTAGRITVLDRDGAVLRQWRMPESIVGRPENLAVLANGNIVVPDTHYHRMVIFTNTGEIVRIFGSKGTADGQFIYPVAVCEHPNGDLFVCEYGSNDRVQRFSADGEYRSQFGAFGTEPGEFQRPSGIEWQDGKLYVSDAANHQLQVFSEDGEHLLSVGKGKMQFPYDLVLAEEGMLIAEWGDGRISRWGFDGSFHGAWGTRGRNHGQLSTPWGLASDGNRVLIADTGNRRIVVVTWPIDG